MMGHSDDVDQRLHELERELDREAVAAGRAVDAPAVDSEDPDDEAPAPTPRALVARDGHTPAVGGSKAQLGWALVGTGIAAVVAVKVVLPLLLAPLAGALWLARAGLRLGILGLLVAGAWSLGRRSRDSEEDGDGDGDGDGD